MIVLHIACLNNRRFSGPNINVPANVIYGNKYAKMGLYNSNFNCDIYKESIKDYFVKDMIKNYDIRQLPEPYNNSDLVVFHSMNLIKHARIAKKLRKYKIPYIIVPRVALTSNAQKKGYLKKKIANLLVFNKYIKNALAIQFLTENEYEESKSFKFKDYFIIGNGTEKKAKTKKYNNADDSKFQITFIGRIEKYHKGLDVLLEAVSLGKEDFEKYGIHINLYGPDVEESVKYLEDKIEKYEISNLVKINPPVYDEEKEDIILASDLFIHTSRMEGHPTSIIEAISYGIPVLVTPGTNMDKEVKENNLGFVADFDANDIKEKIIFAYKSRDKSEQITEREIKYSEENFEWNSIMKKTVDKYKKLLESRKN